MSAHADHEAYLRAALHAAVDSLEPRGDGLERIRARLRRPRPLSLAWAQAASAELIMRAPAWLRDVVYQVAEWFRLVADRFAPTQTGRHRSRAQGLLRPLAAMAVVMFIVAAGTYVAIDASTAIFPSSSSSQPAGGPNAGGHSGAPGAHPSHNGGTQSVQGTGSHSSVPAACKTTSPNTGRSTSAPPPAPSPSASPSPAPTPSDTSASTDTSPAPTDSTTTTPAAASVPPSPAPSANPPTTSPPTLPKPSPSC